MAENYIMINDIMEEHHARMQNLRKYYPFFVLNETTFTQYKDGKYSFLDMGYITMASLRFFINENQFNERAVTYEEYESFLSELLRRDFDLSFDEEGYTGYIDVLRSEKNGESQTAADGLRAEKNERKQIGGNSGSRNEEERELISYIFEKLKNDGRPFEFHFFDPEDKKQKVTRVRLIENEIVDGTVEYKITAEGIEFYLDTKEIKDESKISVEQLLLEKMITAKNFSGGIEVVRRINSEVHRLTARKEAVVELLSHDVFAGAKASEEYMTTVAKWFDEEQKLFMKNKALIEQTLAKASLDNDSRQSNTAFYKSLEEISKLETELKKTIHRHGELIRETIELQNIADKVIHQEKLKQLRNVFDFDAILKTLMRQNDPAAMSYLLSPLMQPKITKQFALEQIDHMLTLRSENEDKGEQIVKENVDRDFLYEDELEDQRIAHNMGRIFYELCDQLTKKPAIELKEFSAILEIKYGEDFLKNGDYYSFLTHVAQKSEYSIQTLYEKPETFLENQVIEAWKEDERERFRDLQFTLTFLPEEEIPFTMQRKAVEEGQQETEKETARENVEFYVTNIEFKVSNIERSGMR